MTSARSAVRWTGCRLPSNWPPRRSACSRHRRCAIASGHAFPFSQEGLATHLLASGRCGTRLPGAMDSSLQRSKRRSAGWPSSRVGSRWKRRRPSRRRGPTSDVLPALERLVEHNLVRREEQASSSRYQLLETIREYVSEQLSASGDAEEARQAHGAYFLAFAEQAAPELYGPRQLEWLSRLEAEHPNLRAALEWFRSEAKQRRVSAWPLRFGDSGSSGAIPARAAPGSRRRWPCPIPGLPFCARHCTEPACWPSNQGDHRQAVGAGRAAPHARAGTRR